MISPSLYFLTAPCVVLACLVTRAVINWRDRRRERERQRRAAHRGERILAGQDWTLPTWERHTTWHERRRSRQTHGGVVIDCLGMVLCSYALLAVLWLFATGFFAL